MRRAAFLLLLGMTLAAGNATPAMAQALDGRWIAEERCAGRLTGRSYVFTIDGRSLTARLAGARLDTFGSILAATLLLPNDSFLIDIPAGGGDGKVSYTGRFNPVGRSAAEGGLWQGDRHTACQLVMARMGGGGGGGGGGPASGKPTVSAGRPEPIPSAPGRSPPATQGSDGVWRNPGGGAPDISAPPVRRAPDATVGRIDQAPPPVARPAPAPAATPAPATASNEVEALRRQLEEERRRRAMAESALRLQEELRRQGGAAPAQ